MKKLLTILAVCSAWSCHGAGMPYIPSSFGNSIVRAANAAAARTLLGVSTNSVDAITTNFSGSVLILTPQLRMNLDASLGALASISPMSTQQVAFTRDGGIAVAYGTGAGQWMGHFALSRDLSDGTSYLLRKVNIGSNTTVGGSVQAFSPGGFHIFQSGVANNAMYVVNTNRVGAHGVIAYQVPRTNSIVSGGNYAMDELAVGMFVGPSAYSDQPVAFFETAVLAGLYTGGNTAIENWAKTNKDGGHGGAGGAGWFHSQSKRDDPVATNTISHYFDELSFDGSMYHIYEYEVGVDSKTRRPFPILSVNRTNGTFWTRDFIYNASGTFATFTNDWRPVRTNQYFMTVDGAWGWSYGTNMGEWRIYGVRHGVSSKMFWTGDQDVTGSVIGSGNVIAGGAVIGGKGSISAVGQITGISLQLTNGNATAPLHFTATTNVTPLSPNTNWIGADPNAPGELFLSEGARWNKVLHDYSITNIPQINETFTGADGSFPAGWTTNSTSQGAVVQITNNTLIVDATSAKAVVYSTNVYNDAQNWAVDFSMTISALGGSAGFTWVDKLFNNSYALAINLDQSGGFAWVFGHATNLINVVQTRTNLFPLAVNDVLDFRVRRWNGNVSAVVSNRNNGLINTVSGSEYSATIVGAATNKYMGPSGWWGFTVNVGGVVLFDNFRTSIHGPTPLDTLFVGDSITAFSADSPLESWQHKVGRQLSGSYSVFGNVSDQTLDPLRAVAQINALNPRRILYALGLNDLNQGSNATAQINITNFYHQMTNAGREVIFCSPTAANSTETSPLARFQMTNYPSRFIDLYSVTKAPNATNLWQPYVVSGDSTHPNQAGHDAIAEAVINDLRYRGWRFRF